jgi:hypothetical protein
MVSIGMQAASVQRVAANTLPDDASASFEGGSVGRWVGVGGTLAASQTQAADGTWSGAVTASGANPRIGPPGPFSNYARVTANAMATLMASLWVSANRTVNLGYQAFDSAGASIGAFNWGGTPALVGGQWNHMTRTIGPMPSNAAYVSFNTQVNGTSVGEIVYFDRLGVCVGVIPSSGWRLPSNPP